MSVRTNVACAQGLFVEASATSLASRSLRVKGAVTGRDVVSSSSGVTLEEITSGAIPTSVTLTTSSEVTATVTIDRALELTSRYVLLALAYGGGTETAILDLESGALAPLANDSDAWQYVVTDLAGYIAWFESRGSLYKATLVPGAETMVDSGEPEYNGSNMTAAVPWPAQTWLYVDSASNVYAFYGYEPPEIDYGFPAAGGPPVSFTSNSEAVALYNEIINSGNRYPAVNLEIDTASGNAFQVGSGTSDSSDIAFAPIVWAVTGSNLGPSEGNEFDVTPAISPVGQYLRRLGAGITLQGSLYQCNDGTVYQIAITSSSSATMTAWNADVVPRSVTDPSTDDSRPGTVTNWQYASGFLYAGPAGSFNGVNGLALPSGGGSASDPAILAPLAAITNWAVVGGSVVYATSSGTYSVPTSASDATSGTLYSSSSMTVEAVTQ